MAWLTYQKQNGRALYLCTASNYRLATLVADYLGFFDGIIASSDEENLSGRRKAKQLTLRFGKRGYDYCGNAKIDCRVWAESEGAIIVNGNESLEQAASSLCEVRCVFHDNSSKWRSVIKALRPHQWAKNILVFIPLATAHKFSDALALEQGLIAFLSFGFCASSVYLLNDMLDLEADRRHHTKTKRPFASGNLSLLWGFFLIPILLGISVILAYQLPKSFGFIVGSYYLLTVAYSFKLKQVVLIDIITLAALYTARIIAGAMAISVPLSFWLLLFSVFLFFSLALVKRYAELDLRQRQGKLKAVGRGYHIEDLPILHSIGTASGYLCVLVLALYINSPSVLALYKHPEIIWLLCILLLYWVSRIWLKTHRGQMHDDPVIFALKDKTSIGIGILSALSVWLAI